MKLVRGCKILFLFGGKGAFERTKLTEREWGGHSSTHLGAIFTAIQSVLTVLLLALGATDHNVGKSHF